MVLTGFLDRPGWGDAVVVGAVGGPSALASSPASQSAWAAADATSTRWAS